ncbi:MAG: carboxylating nicotinate-nucleotide diphosphorylase [Candidatus Omnitrophica bacterium]|nr:carboxylating nicotinate-nucleotide diphosphorylase [Candidatus Omnitrophota bacterium]
MKRLERKVLPIIKRALREDIGSGDVTSQLVVPAGKKIKAVILAKEAGVVCGLDLARLVFKTVDKRIVFRAQTSDGKRVRRGKILARLEGEARSILKAERVALNFLGHLSGIATLTNQFVQRVKPYPVKILDTRKTAPGLRLLEKYAVRCGGGFNHRLGLWDQVLVKDNHLSIVRSSPACRSGRELGVRRKKIKEIIEQIRENKPKGVKIEVEVKSLKEFEEALETTPDIIMLDNFNLKNIKKALRIRDRLRTPNSQLRTQLEVSGGVNLSNLRRIAALGVERISIGALTHSSAALDIALNCE